MKDKFDPGTMDLEDWITGISDAGKKLQEAEDAIRAIENKPVEIDEAARLIVAKHNAELRYNRFFKDYK